MKAQQAAAGATPSGLGGLWFGVLAFRWASLAWMAVLTLGIGGLRYQQLAWFALGATGAWSLYLTLDRRWDRPVVLWFDLALSIALILASGLVAPKGTVIGGNPFFATSYPISTVLTWGVARGPWGGLSCGALLSIAVAFSRPLNGVPFSSLSSQQYLSIGNGAVYYLAAGGTIGLIARLLRRSNADVREANAAAVQASEEAARLAERAALARSIHDSALQSLSLITKRGRELAATESIDPAGVTALADIAEREEQELRTLIARDPEPAPEGRASLREAIERTAREIDGLRTTVSATGAVFMPAAAVADMAAATRQALENVARHAGVERASVFVDIEDGVASVSIRDDGQGFTYDPVALQEAGKLGVLQSMKGRIEGLGGTMTIRSSPGNGTEVEFHMPVGQDESS